MIRLKSLLFILIFIFVTNLLHANDKIAYLDVDKILEQSIIGKKIYKELNQINNRNIENLKKRENQLKTQEQEILKKKSIISTEAFNNEVKKFKENVKIFNEEKNLMVKNFTKKKNDDIQIFLKKINPIIQDYMKKEAISILLDKKNIIMGVNELDITNKLITKINDDLKE
jgi:outer membrane protein|tara:strand:+ start:114 stop:626 length:513 start_codon:yes stop_codon:yes gene_type:complete